MNIIIPEKHISVSFDTPDSPSPRVFEFNSRKGFTEESLNNLVLETYKNVFSKDLKNNYSLEFNEKENIYNFSKNN